ncbi:unnamed protein product [Lymnaea stagnalis]|uniref:L-Fucosyltransferase n=1 Tax=Lymnaea stagnalis TaxID=6523 RepID=A0AAV2HK94_LYMST
MSSSIMGSNIPKRVTTTNLKSSLLTIIVAFALLSVFYMYLITPSFSVRVFSFGLSDQQGNVTASRPNSTAVFSLTDSANISTIHALKITSANNILEQFTNDTTQVSTHFTTSLPATTKAQVKTGPLFMTAAFMGRLGNQLFIYASLLGIARAQNRTAFIRRGTDLEKAFQITHVNHNISTAGFLTVHQSKYATFDPKLMNLSRDNVTLVGYLQVWRYFKNIEDEIRREFTFIASLKKQIDEILDKVRREFKCDVIVGVHVRRGDFLSTTNQNVGYGVAKASYFIKAMDRMRSMLNGTKATFVVSSDDLQWCQENLNFTEVQILAPASAPLHFGVLANCDHVILAGGTYGWWSAWLANGITIYYDKFLVRGTWLMGGANLQDYYPTGWIALGD